MAFSRLSKFRGWLLSFEVSSSLLVSTFLESKGHSFCASYLTRKDVLTSRKSQGEKPNMLHSFPGIVQQTTKKLTWLQPPRFFSESHGNKSLRITADFLFPGIGDWRLGQKFGIRPVVLRSSKAKGRTKITG